MSPPLYLLLLLGLVVFVAFADVTSCGGAGAGDRCGDIVLPFPFHLNSSSSCSSSSSTGDVSSVFRLSCDGRRRNSSLVLRLGAATFRVVGFLSSGSLLLDYAFASGAAASTPCDPVYAALSRASSPAAALDGAAPFLAVTPANVLRLYACEDSSVCRAGCDDVVASCGGKSAAGCCYPLSDGSVWKPGDGLAVFAGFGCRGFSSWVKNRSSSSSSPAQVMMRGIEVEWAVPRGSALAECADGAVPVNASTVRGGVRCSCSAGLVGDGFALGTGCSKAATCSNGGQAGDDGECCHGRFCSKKAVALAGFFVSVFFLAAAMSFWLFLRQPSDNTGRPPWDLDPACIPKILGNVCNARQFTYEQLQAATKRFEDDDGEKPVGPAEVHAGVLDDGTVVAFQRISYDTPEKLRVVVGRVELLPDVSHRNIARVVGFCVDVPGGHHAMVLVHEHFTGGTLEDHLRQMSTGRRRPVLTWHHRVNIAVELASALTYLLHVHDGAPTFVLHDLRCSDIFLDSDLSAKIAGYKLAVAAETSSTYYQYKHHVAEQDVVCNYGHLLMELLTGLRHQQPLDTVAPKVREGRLQEVLDPTLLQAPLSSSSSGRLLPATAEEVRKVVEVAVRCVESGWGEMAEVARELMTAVRDDMGSSSKIEISLEETFSSSSLLQMISMSPDTLQRHLP